MKIVLDTSTIIDFTRSGTGLLPKTSIDENDIYIPTIVISELWAGKSMNRKRDRELIERMIMTFNRVDLDENVAKVTGGLLRKDVVLGFDAVVAATALSLGAHLATENLKHFQKVPNLKLFKV